jgi:hypothetical protein
MSTMSDDEPHAVVGTLVAPLLGVTFELEAGAGRYAPDVRVAARGDIALPFPPWDHLPASDNATLASATHVLELRHVSLLCWHDEPGALHLTDETRSRLTDLLAMLALESRAYVTCVEATAFATVEDSQTVAYSFLLRDFASRLDAVSMFGPVALSSTELARAVRRWQQLRSRHSSLRTAAERLLMSWQRARESHDAIVDYCIAIEALVGDGQSEIVNRISLRTAAMLATLGWGPSSETARAVRDIYAYRSMVVHGVPGPYKKELIRFGVEPPVHAVRFALAVLLSLLEVYFRHDDLTPRQIDDTFVFVAFDSVASLHPPPDGDANSLDQRDYL